MAIEYIGGNIPTPLGNIGGDFTVGDNINYVDTNIEFLGQQYNFHAEKVLYFPESEGQNNNPEGLWTYLGTPVGNRFIILEKPLDAIQFKNENVEYDLDDVTGRITLLAPIINVSYSKNVVQTPVTGFASTVKEVVSGNDYELDIFGTLAGKQAFDYPVDEQFYLNKLIHDFSVLNITNDYLYDVYGITKITPTMIDFTQHSEMKNVIMYNIKAIGE